MRRYYGVNLTEAMCGDVVPLADLAAWAANLPQDSASFKSENPDMPDMFERELLMLDLQRHVLNGLNTANWIASNQGQRSPSKRPEPVLLPWETGDSPGGRQHDALDLETAAESLGGDPRMVAAFSRAMETAAA